MTEPADTHADPRTGTATAGGTTGTTTGGTTGGTIRVPVADPSPGALSADLRVSLMRTVRRLRAEKSDADISDSQYAVLGTLDRLGAMTSAALAGHERVRPPSMTRIVAGLLEAGLVSRAAHPDDGRAQIVELTDAGRAAVAETRRRRDEWLCRQLSRLSAEDRRALARAAVLLTGLSDA